MIDYRITVRRDDGLFVGVTKQFASQEDADAYALELLDGHRGTASARRALEVTYEDGLRTGRLGLEPHPKCTVDAFSGWCAARVEASEAKRNRRAFDLQRPTELDLIVGGWQS